MLVLVLMVLSSVAVAYWGARTIRVRLQRHPAALTLGSWVALDDLPTRQPVPAAG